jgi:hypothetical protein
VRARLFAESAQRVEAVAGGCVSEEGAWDV